MLFQKRPGLFECATLDKLHHARQAIFASGRPTSTFHPAVVGGAIASMARRVLPRF
jgi:hypothetical protein